VSIQPDPSAGLQEIAIIGEAPGVFRVAMLGHLTVTAWFAQLDKASAHVLARVNDDLIARLKGERVSSVHLVNNRVKLPDAGARDVLAKIMRDSAKSVACVTVIIDGDGFWASALRSFVTGLRVLAPGSIDLHAHASIAEVLAWLPPEHFKRAGTHVDAGQLERLLVAGKRWQEAEALTSKA
jgi:hypothetical protein